MFRLVSFVFLIFFVFRAAMGLSISIVIPTSMSPMWMRFTSVDPVRQFQNPYSYGGNNPINGTDPTGEEWFKINGEWVFMEDTPTYEVTRDVTNDQGEVVGSETEVLVGVDLDFEGFDHPRYRQHDVTILEIAERVNQDTAYTIGATEVQGKEIPRLDPLVIKSHLIQESGGGDRRSLEAWAKDPLQVNVPRDFDRHKPGLGLVEPLCRNEGCAMTNINAGVIMMLRKGFGLSAQPPSNRSIGFYDGHRTALERYNGRKDPVGSRMYREIYADRILRRANNPKVHVPIVIKK